MNRPRIHHVSIPRPPGSHDLARAFYGGVLGLAECPVPASLSALDLVWFTLGDGELHLYAQEPINESIGRHFCMEVADLADVRARLSAAGYTPTDTIPIPGRPRFVCDDPFGNPIEFTTLA